VATKGHSISYNNRSLEKRNENAEKRRAQRKRKAIEDFNIADTGPPDKANDFQVPPTKRYV